jgi:bacteriophage exclusion system BrxA-like protein
MTSKRYRISFTSGSLHHLESVQVAELYLELGDWKAVRAEVLRCNLLQARTERTAKTVCREIIDRLKTLNDRELVFLVETDRQSQANLLWIAVCRVYRFVADFAVEVVRERFLAMKNDLSNEDFDAFFNRKAEWHDELDKTTLSTRNKLRQVVFRMLREAGLLTKENTITAVILSPAMVELLHQNNPDDLMLFPVFENGQYGMRS